MLPYVALLAAYPQNSAVIPVSNFVADTITVHNAVTSSRPIVWASAVFYGYHFSGHNPIQMYEIADTVNYVETGIVLYEGYSEPMNYFYGNSRNSADIVLAKDPANAMSGVTIISPSLSSLSGFSGGKTTSFYHPVQYIDSGTDLHQLYFSNDLSTYVNGATPLSQIPLPDSSQYSTVFIAVTQGGNYALVSVGPVMHDTNNYRYVYVAETYQPTAGLPYAGVHTKSSAKH